MKLYKGDKTMHFVDKDQIDICLEAGWSRTKPEDEIQETIDVEDVDEDVVEDIDEVEEPEVKTPPKPIKIAPKKKIKTLKKK